MSSASDGNNAGQSSGQAGEADSLDLDGRQAMKGRGQPQASVPAGQVAETRRAAAEGQSAIDPLVADVALATAEQKRDNGTRPPSETRTSPELALADAQALKIIDRRHEGLQALMPGTLGAVAAREAATSDVSALDGFADKVLQGRAAAVMGDTAEQHPAYRTALREVSPQYAGLADRAYAEEQQRSAAKEDRKALEFASRRDDAADSIVGRYATMASAGLTIKDLQGQAIDRLAVKDSRDLLLIEGFPPHPRASESKALVADSLKSDAYRATFDREAAEWSMPSAGRPAGTPTPMVSDGIPDQLRTPVAMPQAKQGGTAPRSAAQVAADINSMRSEGDTAGKRRAIPPLEDRFNVKRIGLIDKEYHFRDQAGKVAFTDKLLSISTGSESPAAIKAMVDRAAERGWETVRLTGSPEFVRQGWIAATAQGLKAVGHTATVGDREAASKERTRLQVGRDGPAPQRLGEAVGRVQSEHVERVSGDRKASELGGQRQLAAAIEKALVDGRVSPELRGQVRSMMVAEGANRVARGERFKVPVYDARAPRARAKTVQAGPQRHGDRERSR
jgi:Large polyvalent protein-associated domain 7